MRSTSCAVEARSTREAGASVVEFLGVVVLGVVALMVVIQFAVWIWARNVVVNAADEGARVAAESGRALGDGADRTRLVLRDGLGANGARFAVTAEQDGDDVVVRAEGDAPTIVPFLPRLSVRAVAGALDEDAAAP